jgi:hypothetical protein
VLKQICRQCGARLLGVSEKCWYCQRPLGANDIITAGTVLPAPVAPPQAEKERSYGREPQKDFDPLFHFANAVEGIFRGIAKAAGWCLIAALWIGLVGAIIYGLVRFVHWAWYQ